MLTPLKIVMHEAYGELIMYPHPHHQAKRRKKRPIHGVKTVDVTRGKSGYGFTISGQHPCVLSCIVNNSPAERVGLRPGDYLVSVNGIDVSKLGHDEVVRMVGMSTGTLTIQVAENYNSSDSSEDEFVHRAKKYPNRQKRHGKGYNEKMEKLLADINQRDRYCPDGHSHDPNARAMPKQTSGKNDLPRAKTSRPRLHMPVGAENNDFQSDGMSYIEAGAASVFKVPYQKSASTSDVKTSQHRVEPKQAFIKSTSHGQVHAGAGLTRTASQPNQFRNNHMYDNFSPNSLQQIINHSLHSYSAANEAFIMNEDEFAEEGEDDELRPRDGEIRIVVGYIGSLEMPHVRSSVQSIRNAVRRLRVEQKIHTLVLMVVTSQLGVRLVNMGGKEIAHYPVDRLAFSGVCPDDRRFFGIVTLHSVHNNDSTDSEEKEEAVGSSCHVFMVDQELTAHNIHAQKAKSFGIDCTLDPATQRCLEFPRSTTPIILSISNLYKDRPGGTIENDVSRSQVFANPSNRNVEHARSSSSSSNNSNSDSGLGLCRDDAGAEPRVAIVEMPPPPLPARDRPPQLPQIKWSGNTFHLTDGPVRHLTPGPTDKFISHRKTKSDPFKPHPDTSTSSEELVQTSDRLNLRVMPDLTPGRSRLSGDGLEHQNAAENLRLGMQKLIQARQRQTGLDQTSSDTESRSSRGELFTSSLKERPVSAPFKYLSHDSSGELKMSKSDLSSIKHDSDSSLADKLSPRAFLSSAFTPVGSVGSAFKKVRSRPLINQLRSPSAPPIPSYHGDDEDSEEEGVHGAIKRLHRDRSHGQASGVSSGRRTADILYTPVSKRDQERKGATISGTPQQLTPTSSGADKWTKAGQSSSLRKKGGRRNTLSLSHESLVVVDQDQMQQKLSSANSVNSIVHHVAKAIEQEEVGRVASWAVNLEKLLNDPIGISVFTEFLKKEFSEENIVFWKASETYKTISDTSLRKTKAKEIYETHVSERGAESVNIDSVARKQVESELDNPTPQTFKVAQQQIFQLMKQDSYARFLKSDLYKTWHMKELDGEPIEVTPSEQTDKNKLSDKHMDKESKKKGGKGKENEEQHKEKRRRSLLPWRQKTKKPPKSETSDTKATKGNKDESENNNIQKSNNNNNNNNNNTEGASKHKETPVQIVEVPETINEEPETPKFCRVIMPDGSTTVVGTKQGQTINYVLGKLCVKRNLSIASVDVFLLGSEKPLNLNDDISTIGSKEVTIEKRVLFRMELPNKKSIGVKAKPNRLIRDVFKPILNKYGYRIDALDVHLSGQSELLSLDSQVSSIDSQRVIVLNQSTDAPTRRNGLLGRYLSSAARPPLPNKYSSSKPGTLGTSTNNNINNNNNDYQSLDELTNQIFGNLMMNKSDILLAPPPNFDELGILDLASGNAGKMKTDDALPSLEPLEAGRAAPVAGMEGKDHGKVQKVKQKVTFALQKNTVRNRPSEDEEADSQSALCERLKRAQDQRLDDQRGLVPHDLELPDFLQDGNHGKVVGRDSATGTADCHRVSPLPDADYSSVMESYLENINENVAVYTRDSRSSLRNPLFGADARATTQFTTFGTPNGKLKASDKSFTEDGIVPSNDEAAAFFQAPSPGEHADFEDPQLMEKSLTDIGFTYKNNKYLSKSRNFVNQTQKKALPKGLFTETVTLSEDSFPVVQNPSQRALVNQHLDVLDSTLPHSPRSSPYDSDSSLEKENIGKFVPKSSSVGNIRRNSRHTKLHSPIHTSTSENFLSTVDTDGKYNRPSGGGITVVGEELIPKIIPAQSQTVRNITDEVTFV